MTMNDCDDNSSLSQKLSHAELQMQSQNLAALQHPLLQRGTATVSI